jgi:hypothetical protein
MYNRMQSPPQKRQLLYIMNSNNIPHISRFNPAAVFGVLHLSVLLLLVALLVGINIYLGQSGSTIDPYHMDVLKRPMDPSVHQKLARLYWSNKKYASARRELALGDTFSTSPAGKASNHILGVRSFPVDIMDVWNNQSSDALAAYAYWRTVADDKPDYISAKLMAAGYALRLDKRTEAEDLLESARALDPTNIQVRALDNAMRQP